MSFAKEGKTMIYNYYPGLHAVNEGEAAGYDSTTLC